MVETKPNEKNQQIKRKTTTRKFRTNTDTDCVCVVHCYCCLAAQSILECVVQKYAKNNYKNMQSRWHRNFLSELISRANRNPYVFME